MINNGKENIEYRNYFLISFNITFPHTRDARKLRRLVLIFIFSQQFRPKFGSHWSMLRRMGKSFYESDGDRN